MRWSVGVLLVASLVACAPSVRVKTAQDPQADLGVYQTFAMLQPNKPIPSENPDVDPFVLQRLRQLTYLGLKDKGYVPTSKEQAELLVGVMAARDTRYYSMPTRPYNYSYDPYFARAGWSDQITTIDERIVVIDLVDRGKKAVIWRGTGVRALDSDTSDAELREITDAILAEFPTRGGSRPVMND